MLKKLTDSDAAMKAVFDHFRNVGIASAVIAAAIWVYNNPNQPGLSLYFDSIAAIILGVIGAFLFVANELHAHKKLNNAGLRLGWEAIIRLAYSSSIFYFVWAVISRSL